MPRGSSPKRERQYEELLDKFRKSGRYKGRQKEVASRIVNKQRKQYGETKGERQRDKEGKSPDRNLPIKDYQHLTVGEVVGRLDGCSKKQLEKIRYYEQDHKGRKTLLEQIDRRL